jgi:hypothetical protein
MAAQFREFAADHGYSEARLNPNRYLRLLDQWESPDHLLKLFHIHHPPFICSTSFMVSSKIQNHWMMMDIDCSIRFSD